MSDGTVSVLSKEKMEGAMEALQNVIYAPPASSTAAIPPMNRKGRMEALIAKYTQEPQEAANLATVQSSLHRPWNYQDFLHRLHSFDKSYNWFAKDASISAIRCALRGWCNTGMNTLHCHVCGADVVHPEEQDRGNILVEGHLSTCKWRQESCTEAFLHIPNHYKPSLLLADLKERLVQAAKTLVAACREQELLVDLSCLSQRVATLPHDKAQPYHLLQLSTPSLTVPVLPPSHPAPSRTSDLDAQLQRHLRGEERDDLFIAALLFAVTGWDGDGHETFHCNICSRTLRLSAWMAASPSSSQAPPPRAEQTSPPAAMQTRATTRRQAEGSDSVCAEPSDSPGAPTTPTPAVTSSPRRAVSLLAEHRYFCPWAKQDIGFVHGGQAESAAGYGSWELCLDAWLEALGQKKRPRPSLESVPETQDAVGPPDSENAYKRIRALLQQATSHLTAPRAKPAAAHSATP